jgi:hypothetical protein
MKSVILVLFAFVFSIAAFGADSADQVKSVRVPAPVTIAPNYAIRMNSVCYNPTYGLGAYQSCMDDAQVLTISSTPQLEIQGQCAYIRGCGPWAQPTYQMDILAYTR